MSDPIPENNNNMQIIPANINARIVTEPSQYQQDTDKRDYRDKQTVDAVMYLNKLEQDKIILENRPRREKLEKDLASVFKKLERKAAKLLAGLKVDEEAKELKKALEAWDILGVKFDISQQQLNIDERVVEITKKITCKHESYDGLSSEAIDVPFTDEMVKLADQYDKLVDDIRVVTKTLADAEAKLMNRALLRADAHGALAIKRMSTSDIEDVKSVYEKVSSGVTVEKLLGAKKDK